MTLLSDKVAEMMDLAVLSPHEHLVWRGLLDTQEWKIQICYTEKDFQMRIKRRDSSTGDPE